TPVVSSNPNTTPSPSSTSSIWSTLSDGYRRITGLQKTAPVINTSDEEPFQMNYPLMPLVTASLRSESAFYRFSDFLLEEPAYIVTLYQMMQKSGLDSEKHQTIYRFLLKLGRKVDEEKIINLIERSPKKAAKGVDALYILTWVFKKEDKTGVRKRTM